MMNYCAYEGQRLLTEPMRMMARGARDLFGPLAALPGGQSLGHMLAGWEMVSRTSLTHERPPYRIKEVVLDGRTVAVTEEVAATSPFCTLLRFRKAVAQDQPRVLLVAPLSGHFSTLLRDTIRTLLIDHDVFVTDWHNVRDVPLSHGDFGFEDHIDHLIGFLETMGPGAHVVAVCQPCVQVLAAVAIMAENSHPAQPRTMTLMAGPIDTRINPTKVNELATTHSIAWFEENLIGTVPKHLGGAGRRVYPGYLQLTAFMAMNSTRHTKAHRELYMHLARGEAKRAEEIKTFYDEYFAVCDLPAKFYLETVKRVFQDALLAKGQMIYKGRRIDTSAIRKTALLTVEGELDDICSIGQTLAAHDLCSKLKPYMKRHHLQAGAGHYGVFSGSRWRNQIYPMVRNLMLSAT